MACHSRHWSHCRCSLQSVGVNASMCIGNIWDNIDRMRIYTHAETQMTPTKVLFGPTRISFQAAVGLAGGFRQQWDCIQHRGDKVSCQGLHDTVSGKMEHFKYISGKTFDETSFPLPIKEKKKKVFALTDKYGMNLELIYSFPVAVLSQWRWWKVFILKIKLIIT